MLKTIKRTLALSAATLSVAAPAAALADATLASTASAHAQIARNAILKTV